MHIINVGQLFNLEHHSGMLNQFTVRLQSGREVAIVTDEHTVAQLIDVAAQELTGTVRQPSAPPQEEPFPAEVTEFGGDLPDPGESLAVPEPPVMGTVEEEAPEYRRDKLGQEVMRPTDRRGALGGGHPNKKGRVSRYRTVESVPARTVPMDEKGNPIVPSAHRAENQSTMTHLGPGVDDEDGTSI